ncbi:MAG: hypothetical protein M3R55_15685 [Acidobacteriota bacterium]|nr:hypothetical protein [Acidobacteriota bacterium]
MLTIMLTAALAAASIQQQATPPPQPQVPAAQRPNPCDRAEFRQFDCWIGSWEVKGPQGRVIGANIIEPIAGNCGIHENWSGGLGGAGRSVNTFQASDGKWHQAWGRLRRRTAAGGFCPDDLSETAGPTSA